MNKSHSRHWDKRALRARDAKGFTLIELLVVVVILGVLIAIAIPLYLNYRKGANDSAAQSDLKNAINVMEQCNADNGQYPNAASSVSISRSTFIPDSNPIIAKACKGVVNLSNGTTLRYSSTNGISFRITDTNSAGSSKTYCYNSANGGSVKQSTTC